MSPRPVQYVYNGEPHRARRQEEIAATGSLETLGEAIGKYDISAFAHDDPRRFAELVSLMCPRDQEIISLFSVLQKRPTELSILFGKAGHRAEEDIHKAAHKFAGLAAYGPLPELRVLGEILERNNLGLFATHSFAACLWQYARSRDFVELARLLGQNGLRQQMFRAFKILHAAEGREEGLLAGWVLWLVDGSHPTEKGWMKRQRHGREYQLGPTVFRSNKVPYGQDKESITSLVPRFTGPHGRAEGAAVVKIGRKMKFMLRGATL